MFTRKQILDAANKHYPDHYLSNYFNANGQPCRSNGDKLAEFIVNEITEVMDHDSDIVTRLNDIRDRMEAAMDDICLVLDGVKELHNSIPGHEECWEDEEEEEEA